MIKSDITIDHQKLLNYNPQISYEDYDIQVGNGRFIEDVWDFNGLINSPHKKGAKLQIKFAAWNSRPEMKITVKHYIASVLLSSKFDTAKRMMDGIVKFLSFLNEERSDIYSFEQVNKECLREYYSWLLQIKSGRDKNKSLSGQSIKKAGQAIHDLMRIGSVKGWKVPDFTSHINSVYQELILNNKRVRSETSMQENRTKTIPLSQNVIDNLFKCLEKEDEMILAKASVYISSQTGLRINEFITLTEGCLVEGIDGELKLRFQDRKIRKETIYREVPANKLVVSAIAELEEHTRKLREDSNLKYLFLRDTVNGIMIPEMSNWTRDVLKPLIKKWDLRDENGHPLHLTAHVFRHVFATYAIKQGVRVEALQEILGHESIRMTEHYSTPIQERVKERFGEILSESAIIAGKSVLQIKDRLKNNNPFKGKTTNEIDSLRRAMKVQVLPHGLCTHHPMRHEPCIGDGVCLGCNNYITTPEFLPIHTARLERVESELALFGDGPYANKLKNQRDYLIKIIDDLTIGTSYNGDVDNFEES